ncbi:signal transduction histidine kinase [Sanguibacter keddieii DSM 10542]|uniref:histidine kinase n=1 Tax=Sanguibacter keddieii (strain ATCC 51767 / DSM 10542 / NCFB 3025 / ST-74) TaxID=446469 RepID=D1BIJ6_SANKS|nr:ATP-binding protein [Sanguibacter keddieii]ACZ22173.1 signal transduction histidine kinase [Sanguibacter keddieii DSM 10542]
MTLDPLFGRVSEGRSGVLLYQLPTLAVLVLALGTLPLSGVLSSTTMVVTGTLVVVAVSVAALVLPWKTYDDRWVVLVPVVSLVGLGLVRYGTGGVGSPYSAMLFVPFVWIALAAGRHNALVAAVALVATSQGPGLLLTDLRSTSDLVRVLFSPLVYGLVALVINEIARRLRLQLADARATVAQRDSLLVDAVRASAEARSSETRATAVSRQLSGLWDAVTEQAIIGTDLTGRIDSWNPGACKMLGVAQHEALEAGLVITDVHVAEELRERVAAVGDSTPLDAQAALTALVRDVGPGSADVREWTYVRPDDSRLPVQVAATQRIGDDDAVVGYLFVATDMTKAREFERLKDEFVGMISHELRTPLSSILGYLELLRDEEDGPLTAEQTQYLDVAERNAQRLLRLVGDLLFTAQVEAGRFPIVHQSTELESVLRAAAQTFEPVAAAASVRLRVVMDESLSTVVRGDATRLGQAVDNLLSNAVKFSPAGGQVTLSLVAHDERATITVRDTGIGIPDTELDQLTTRFFRASTATSASVPGIGLGLAITKAIVVAHRGRLDVTSEVGIGTAFTVDLPTVVE